MYSIVCRMYLHCRFDPTQAAAAVARYRIDGGWTAPALPGRDYVCVRHRRGFNCARNYDFTSPKLLPFIAEMRVERLAMNLEELSKFRSINLAHPLFHSVTLRISTYLASSASQRNLYQMARTPHTYDVRFVIAIDGDYWGNWLASARGLPDFWAQADAFVACKRNGDVGGRTS
ncbi:hypothetical protein B0H14DRAFT_2621938 [Mycena olivaceomarginata]|nr:hypothetical protein B0H14DRAFT_2621938 [Mycena olivaceomarginata]